MRAPRCAASALAQHRATPMSMAELRPRRLCSGDVSRRRGCGNQTDGGCRAPERAIATCLTRKHVVRDRTRRLRGGHGLGGGEERRRRRCRQTISATAAPSSVPEQRLQQKLVRCRRRRRQSVGGDLAEESPARQMQPALLRTPRRVAREVLCQTGFRPSSCDGRQTSKAGCAGARPLSSQTRVPKRPRRRSPARRSDARSWASHAAGQQCGDIGKRQGTAEVSPETRFGAGDHQEADATAAVGAMAPGAPPAVS